MLIYLDFVIRFYIFEKMRQTGEIVLTGNYRGFICYQREGQFCTRSVGNMCTKRYNKDKRFKESRAASGRFGKGNALASVVYRSLPEAEQVYPLYCRLKSMVPHLMKSAESEEKVVEELKRVCAEWTNSGNGAEVKPKAPRRFQHVVRFKGHEDLPLHLCKKDVEIMYEGKPEETEALMKRLKKRLAAKLKKREKEEAAKVEVTEKITIAISRRNVRKIAKPVVLRPKWRRAVYPALTTIAINAIKTYKRPRAPVESAS